MESSTRLHGTAPAPMVFIAEDDTGLAVEVADCLGLYDFETRIAHSWPGLLGELSRTEPDVILLDKHLGQVNTVARITELRRQTSARIIVVTGSADETDRIVGLELGADGFLMKPVASRELVARTRAALRRGRANPPVAGAWRVREETGMLEAPDGRRIAMAPAHLAVLRLLVERPGHPVPRSRLAEVLADAAPPRPHDDLALAQLLRELRRQLSRLGAGHALRALRKQGWVFLPGPPA